MNGLEGVWGEAWYPYLEAMNRGGDLARRAITHGLRPRIEGFSVGVELDQRDGTVDWSEAEFDQE